uniref:Ovule protein n=1 Tax=Steinernema glaseri TaxID=37863 RepID=A0A1I7ZID9_9BILA
MCIRKPRVKAASKREPNEDKLASSKATTPNSVIAPNVTPNSAKDASAKSGPKETKDVKKSDKVLSTMTQPRCPTNTENQTAQKSARQKSHNSVKEKEKDKSQEKMSPENTLKEVPNQMPELELQIDAAAKDPIFTNEQLL